MEEVRRFSRRNTMTIEERNFHAALVLLEAMILRKPGFGPKIKPEVKKMISATLEMSLNKADIRECLASNVDIWMRLERIITLAIPGLASRSLRESYETVPPTAVDAPESASLILKNYYFLVEDLPYLNTLMVISRNMLAIKEVAQEICAAVNFHKTVHRLIILCVNVTSKGYDGENVNDLDRDRLNEVTDLYKKLLVTCLQHTHNWTMGNDRFKMSFWFDMLFDNDLHNNSMHELPADGLRVEIVYDEVRNWLIRHQGREPQAAKILDKYVEDVKLGGPNAGMLPEVEISSGNTPGKTPELTSPLWKPELGETDKYEQDRIYARVSHEIDTWWKRVRDTNYEGWVVPMETVESAISRAESCKEYAMHRYIPRGHDPDQQYDHDEQFDEPAGDDTSVQANADDRSVDLDENGEEGDEEEEEEDDDSYVEAPLRGLLTEIPNILDCKQIEALHMTVKACIVDAMGSGLTVAGENLQKTRCKMFLALDCGKNLFREMLVFIAVWEQNDTNFIFQITAQIIESFHHNALLPYAWNSLRILKDIVSPAQTVLLRLINYMFRARKESPIYDDPKDYNRDAKLIHFLYNYFRMRVVPDCIALIYAQAQIRHNKSHPNDFPVDLWDMERAKDGLSQYLDFISVIADMPEMRGLLIEWEAIYELIALLKALEEGVARKSLTESVPPRPPVGSADYDNSNPHPRPALPPLHDTPYKFPWSGIKIQILIILTSLVAPDNKQRNGSGNPVVQKQLLKREGIMPLLNCCVYDGHNEFLKERATLAIKFVMEGCDEAQKFVRELVPIKQAQASAQAQAQAVAHHEQSQKALAHRLKEKSVPFQHPRDMQHSPAPGQNSESSNSDPSSSGRNAILDQLAKMAADGKVAVAERTAQGMNEAEATADVQKSLKMAEDMVKSLAAMEMDDETRAKIAEAVRKMDEKAARDRDIDRDIDALVEGELREIAEESGGEGHVLVEVSSDEDDSVEGELGNFMDVGEMI